METIKVYSVVEDKNIQKNLNDSPIWKQAIHPDDLESVKDNYETLYEYAIKFDGLRPVQVAGVKKYK